MSETVWIAFLELIGPDGICTLVAIWLAIELLFFPDNERSGQ